MQRQKSNLKYQDVGCNPIKSKTLNFYETKTFLTETPQTAKKDRDFRYCRILDIQNHENI